LRHAVARSGYRFEALVLGLVALAALPVVNLTGPQDRTRYELTRHVVLYHTLTLEPSLFDRAVFAGKTYSDKAPGMSFLAIPGYEGERVLGIAKAPAGWDQKGDLSLWLLRVLTSGLLFLVSVLLVGRLAERFVPGTGAMTAAIFGTATIAAPLAPTFFEHDAAGAWAIAAFALALQGSRRSLLALAGLCAGIAVLFEYATALVVVAVLVLCAARHGRRAGWFVLGGVPPAAALAAYDWSAFGSPFHLSYRYIVGQLGDRQHHGFFGIGLPTLHGLNEVLFVDRGLLVLSPVLAAAAAGLVLMWRRGHRGEAAVALVVVAGFLVSNAGYFLPYGGGTPGPRFFAAALPFLALGLPFALTRFRRTTLLLAAASIVLMTGDSVTWGVRKETDRWYPGHGFSDLSKTVWVWLGVNRIVGAGIVLLCAFAAFAVGLRGLRGRPGGGAAAPS
jgi:4-amino-4-deoxy-L-arabinose transferase-like glycosyltransferase